MLTMLDSLALSQNSTGAQLTQLELKIKSSCMTEDFELKIEP